MEKKRYPDSIINWPEGEKPRERLLKYGAKSLTDAELLAIILRTGTLGDNAIELARKILTRYKALRNIACKNVSELKKIKGLGNAKISQILAAFEIGKRFIQEKSLARPGIRTSEDIISYIKPELRDLKKEIFKLIILNSKNKVLKTSTISEGTLTQSLVHPREVLKEAIIESAASVIFVHNHPSGEPKPSSYDIKLTKELIKAFDLVGIKVLDHIIIGDNDYYSFFDNGIIEDNAE
jgi:DNA repair protein RadC